MADWLPAMLVCFLLMLVILVSGTPDDQCRFVFKEDMILNVSLSSERGAIVKYDFHAHDRFQCAEECCSAPGDWCSLALYTMSDTDKANCFLIQCVPDFLTEDVCVRVHRRNSGMFAVEVAHPSHDMSTAPSYAPSSGGSVTRIGGSSTGSSANEGSLTSSLTSPSTPVDQHSDINQHSTSVPRPSNPLSTQPTLATSVHSSTAANKKVDVTPTEPKEGTEKPVTIPSSLSTNGGEQEPTHNGSWPQENTENNGTESSGEVNDNLGHDEDVIYGRETVSQTGILIVTLCFGIIFFLTVTVVVTKRWMDGYRRRKYSKVDYLINGIYS